jgi:hydrogenase-4 component B
MLTVILICSAFFVFIGIVSASARDEKAFLRKAAPAALTLVSLIALLYMLVNFRMVGEAVTMHWTGWQMPFAAFSLGLDPLSGFFLIPLLILTVSSSLYGPRYFAQHGADRTHWLFYSLLIVGMVMVLVARNAVLFIIAWEVMSVSSFFLVISDKKNPVSIKAGWIYFVTAHIGTAFLFALFFLLSSATGSPDFALWKLAGISGHRADIVFILALVAFGLKAGFVPFHVWLPLAHPAAPSHISALMSGIMIKMGIYGILRILTILAPFHSWWGILLIALGGVSGVLGVLFAIGQHDIKRLLAYSSVENIGIILLGIGLGIIGAAFNCAPVALFGFAGGLLHVVNHSLFKGLLFLGAGAVIRQTGSGEIDRLGGLIKSMPQTGFLFLLGSLAICGLPFFNGFVSELMIYAGSIRGAVNQSQPVLSMLCLTVALCLALIGGLAVACFIKVFGATFLGAARSDPAKAAFDAPVPMLIGMWILAGFCFLIGMCCPVVYPYLVRPALMLASASTGAIDPAVLASFTVTLGIVLALCAFLATIVGFLSRALARKKPRATSVTWDCGYCLPDATMQYTASSLSAPIVDYFKRPIAASRTLSHNDDFFPDGTWNFKSLVDDWFLSKIFVPFFRWCDKAFGSLRWFQNGKSGQYVLYIVVMLLCLIVWKFFL